MRFELVISFVGLIGSLSSIVFAYLAFRRSERQEQLAGGKTEGVIFSDIGYIKACVDRTLKNLNKVDERDRSIVGRLAKVEKSVANVTKRVDEMYKLDST